MQITPSLCTERKSEKWRCSTWTSRLRGCNRSQKLH